MLVINSTKLIAVDIDRTLLFTEHEYYRMVGDKDKDDFVHLHISSMHRVFYLYLPHVEIIRDFKARGHTIIAWSAGGAEWAEVAIKSIYDLQDIVSLVISKPDWYIDDKSASDFLGVDKQVYLLTGKE